MQRKLRGREGLSVPLAGVAHAREGAWSLQAIVEASWMTRLCLGAGGCRESSRVFQVQMQHSNLESGDVRYWWRTADVTGCGSNAAPLVAHCSPKRR